MVANLSVTDVAQMVRKLRRPTFPFYLKSQPFHIQPFHISHVLPGETLKNLRFQVRAVTDPILNPLMGWWNGYWFFYVKLSDLYERDDAQQIAINPDFSVTPLITAVTSSATNRPTFFAGGVNQIDWLRLCYRRIVDCYWRDESERYSDHQGDSGHSLAQIHNNSWLDSLCNVDQLTAVDVDVDGPDVGTTIQYSEIELARARYEALKDNNLVEMSYEDFLERYGVKQPRVEPHKPELIRYIEDWQYPSNTIDPTNGTPRSAVSWSMKERADKDRRFDEPGFIIGLACCRPKVYSNNVVGTLTSSLNTIYDWLPPWLQTNWRSSFKAMAYNQGPLPSNTDDNGYAWDWKDLMRYGEPQFYTPATETASVNKQGFPGSGQTSKRYPFVSADWGANIYVDQSGSTGRFIRHDGVVDLTIATKWATHDTSPRGGQVNENADPA